MNFRFLPFLALVFVVALGACKKEETTDDDNTNTNTNTNNPPALTDKYYFQAKIDGEWLTYQTGSPGYVDGNYFCGSTFGIPLGSGSGMSLEIGWDSDFDSGDINALDGATLGFDDAASPYGRLFIITSGEDENTLSSDQSGSAMVITSVTSEGTYNGVPAFLVKGTLNCTIYDENDNAREVTEGTFAIVVWEYV